MLLSSAMKAVFLSKQSVIEGQVKEVLLISNLNCLIFLSESIIGWHDVRRSL
jgi:hypothetical protein